MKFGVISHTTMNIGDDIQTYAAAKLLPHVDYEVNRETIDSFQSENNEPVAVVMNAWWMWKKWNWPPAECIIPLLTSIHINEYGVKRKGSPIQEQMIQGIGGDFLKSYGPVGCRDSATMKFLEENGIDSYFSGCLTLTLPKQKATEDAGTYVCFVDLNPAKEAKAREYLKDTGLEIRVFSHDVDYRSGDLTLEERFRKVEERLIQYQNAKFVITRRLHATLPCIALGTPVLSVIDMKNTVGNMSRWQAYIDRDIVRCIDDRDFIDGNFEYNFNNPPENKSGYLKVRQGLIEQVEAFVREYESCDLPLSQVKKTTYTAEEKILWQNSIMKEALDLWLKKSRALLSERNTFKKSYNAEKERADGYKKQLDTFNKREEKYKNQIKKMSNFGYIVKFFIKCFLKKLHIMK